MNINGAERRYMKIELANSLLGDEQYNYLAKSDDSIVATNYAICIAYREGIDAFLSLDITPLVKNSAIYHIIESGKHSLTKEDKQKLIAEIDPSIDRNWDAITTKGVAPLLTKKFPVEKIPYAYLVSNRKSDVKKALEYYKNNKLPYRNIHITKFLGSVLLEFNDKDLIAKFVRKFVSDWCHTNAENANVLNLIKSKNLSIFDIADKDSYSNVYYWMYSQIKEGLITENFILNYFEPVFKKYKNEFNIKVLDEGAKTDIEIDGSMLDGYKEFVKREKKEVV